MSRSTPELLEAFAAVMADRTSATNDAWREFGVHGQSAPDTAATDPAAGSAAGQNGAASPAGFCSTRRCRVFVGVSVAVAIVLIVGHDAADAIGDGVVDALTAQALPIDIGPVE